MKPVRSAAVFGHVDVAPPGQRLAGQKQACHAVAGVHVIDALDRARPDRKWLACLADQLCEGLVYAHDRALRIIGSVIDLQHILHVEDEVRRGLLGNAPHPPQMRFERVLF